MAYLKRISIKGFRSIKEADIRLENLNILIGANGSGKSNFISFFKMLGEMMAGRLQTYIATSGGAKSLLYLGPKVSPELSATIRFEAKWGPMEYCIGLLDTADDNLAFAQESPYGVVGDELVPWQLLGNGHRESQVANGALGEIPSFKQALSNIAIFHFHDTSPTAAVRRPSNVNDNHQLRPDAGNLAALLHAFRLTAQKAYQRIVSAIGMVMPGFDDFDLNPDRINPNEIKLNWRKVGSDYLFGPHQISDGSLRAMALITLLLQPKADRPDLIILDEPELGLHPAALEMIAGLIQAASLDSQIIVATQSQSFLDYFKPSEVIVVDADKDGSHFRRLNEEDLKDWLADYSIGTLWEKNVFGGGPFS
jgi:predicted ATPase